MKKIFVGIGTILLLLGIVSCSLNHEEFHIMDVLDEYYSKNMPKNTGKIELFKHEKLGEYTLVLAEKYPGEGESSMDVFILDKDSKIVASTYAARAQSPCYTVNSFIWEDNQIIFGDLKDTKYNLDTDEMDKVDLKSLEVIFKNKEILKINIEDLEIFTIITDIKDEIEEVNVYNDKDELTSFLSETIYNKLDLTSLK